MHDGVLKYFERAKNLSQKQIFRKYTYIVHGNEWKNTMETLPTLILPCKEAQMWIYFGQKYSIQIYSSILMEIGVPYDSIEQPIYNKGIELQFGTNKALRRLSHWTRGMSQLPFFKDDLSHSDDNIWNITLSTPSPSIFMEWKK